MQQISSHRILDFSESSASFECLYLAQQSYQGFVVGVVKGEGNRDRQTRRLGEGVSIERTCGRDLQRWDKASGTKDMPARRLHRAEEQTEANRAVMT